jgi:hypothetical protein
MVLTQAYGASQRAPIGVSCRVGGPNLELRGAMPAMPSQAAALRRELRRAGVSERAIKAVWPSWWSDDAEGSLSAATELRYAVARRLGIAPSSLFEGNPRFVWRDETKFKSLSTESVEEQAILASFGASIGAALASAMEPQALPQVLDPLELRTTFLRLAPWVGLGELLTFCWAIGVPVVHIDVFPLPQKRMHAMTVRAADHYAILLGRDSSYISQVAYTLAHEVAHLFLGHLESAGALVDITDPLMSSTPDDEEGLADRFALALLTGSAEPNIIPSDSNYNGTQLAQAAIDVGQRLGIAPGILSLCLGHATGRWTQSFSALKRIPGERIDTATLVNQVALSQLAWDSLSDDTSVYLRRVMGLSVDA